MCTVLLPPGVNPIAVKYIISYHIIYHIIPYHIISYRIISYNIIPYHIISYHIIPYHIISYHTIKKDQRQVLTSFIVMYVSSALFKQRTPFPHTPYAHCTSTITYTIYSHSLRSLYLHHNLQYLLTLPKLTVPPP
jgi:hypothetical protein